MKLRNPNVEKVKVEELVEDRFMKKLDQSGFIDEMYAVRSEMTTAHDQPQRFKRDELRQFGLTRASS
jgi:hypothetical protein